LPPLWWTSSHANGQNDSVQGTLQLSATTACGIGSAGWLPEHGVPVEKSHPETQNTRRLDANRELADLIA
jgi:hypothetical protein